MPESMQLPGQSSDAARVRRLREILGLSQRELAEEFGVAHGAVGLWETKARALPGPVGKLLALYEAELGLPSADERGGLTRLRTSWVGRGLSLSRTGAAVAARAAAGALQRVLVDQDAGAIRARTQIAIARRVAASLGEMKGFAMKVGLLASYLDFELPDEARESLAALQGATRPLAPSAVAKVFLEEMGQGPGKLFADWSCTPLAAASIGQVHRARLKTGEEVAVKVQYPGILEALAADLGQMALIERALGFVLRGHKAGELVNEIRERVIEECDFRREAAYQEEFRQIWAGHPGVHVPRVFRELSTRRILVTELIRGESLAQFDARASQAEKDRAGALIYQFAFGSIFQHGLFNCDPHPGNYLFVDGAVAFLDFGCVRRLNLAQVERWRRFVQVILRRDREALDELIVDAGMVPNRARFDFERHAQTVSAFYQPALCEGRFRFTPDYMTATWRASTQDNPNRFWANVPGEWMMARKVQWGVYAVLAQLRASANWRAMTLPLVGADGQLPSRAKPTAPERARNGW
jgi:predicted unusual protein kinase regulating ubiquinone biosynthesis (AarF/ABC1/UbiB family)